MSTLAFVSSKTEEFAADVRAGLLHPVQKELHSKYLYDELGSALFEAITVLPEYGLTRADTRILHSCAAQLADAIRGPVLITELGSGTGQKTRPILEAFRDGDREVRYAPIDVSSSALARCQRDLEDIVEIRPVLDSYLPAMRRVAVLRKPAERLLVLFLGSTIGNFEPHCATAFLSDLRHLMRVGDALLLGADLVKPAGQLIAAYDDPAGVTAAFNLNLLGRVNRELGADFNLRNFAHEARYNERDERVEMHLRSRVPQSVFIRDAHCTVHFDASETIWTESSHKFRLPGLEEMARQCGFRPEARWVDDEWPFAESLWIAH